jgi:hypothetical protein
MGRARRSTLVVGHRVVKVFTLIGTVGHCLVIELADRARRRERRRR